MTGKVYMYVCAHESMRSFVYYNSLLFTVPLVYIQILTYEISFVCVIVSPCIHNLTRVFDDNIMHFLTISKTLYTELCVYNKLTIYLHLHLTWSFFRNQSTIKTVFTSICSRIRWWEDQMFKFIYVNEIMSGYELFILRHENVD